MTEEVCFLITYDCKWLCDSYSTLSTWFRVAGWWLGWVTQKINNARMDAVFDAMIRSKCSTHIRCFLVVVLTYCGLRWGLVRKALRIYMILGRFSEVPLRIVVQLWVAFYIRANRLQTKRCATTTSELVKSTYLSPARRLAWTTQHWNSWHRSLYLIFLERRWFAKLCLILQKI